MEVTSAIRLKETDRVGTKRRSHDLQESCRAMRQKDLDTVVEAYGLAEKLLLVEALLIVRVEVTRRPCAYASWRKIPCSAQGGGRVQYKSESVVEAATRGAIYCRGCFENL